MPRGRKSKKKQEQKKLNITVAILIVLSILLAVLIYTKSGYLGQTLSPALGGVLGYIKYLVPIALFAFSLKKWYNKTDYERLGGKHLKIQKIQTILSLNHMEDQYDARKNCPH